MMNVDRHEVSQVLIENQLLVAIGMKQIQFREVLSPMHSYRGKEILGTWELLLINVQKRIDCDFVVTIYPHPSIILQHSDNGGGPL